MYLIKMILAFKMLHPYILQHYFHNYYNLASFAGYMSNIKEAVFAYLAATSIGAIWGGPLPFYGDKVRYQ